jgi:hypothetical protein
MKKHLMRFNIYLKRKSTLRPWVQGVLIIYCMVKLIVGSAVQGLLVMLVQGAAV